MKAAQLVAMSEDDLDEFTGWIDWRSEEEEVVYAVQEHTGEPLESTWEGDDFLLKWGDSTFKIPLTMSSVDRYVAINSLAEILKEKYQFFLRVGYDGSDTHGLLVVDKECAAELEQNHADWLRENFEKLKPGIDHFSGLKIPYYGNENNNPKLQDELDDAEAAVEEFKGQLPDALNFDKVGRDIRVKLGVATPKDKFFHYLRRYWWVIFFLLWVWLR